MLNELADFIT